MAQPRARGQGEQAGGTPAAGKASAPETGSAGPASRFSLSRLLPSRVDRTGAGGTPGATPPKSLGALGGVGKLVLTMAIILISAPLGDALLAFIFSGLHISVTQVLVGKGIPLLGGMTLFTFCYLVYIILIYIALFKFNIFPRDLFGARAKAEARARERAAARTTSSASSSARASRRAGRHATVATTTPTAKGRRAAATKMRPEPAAPIIGHEFDAEHARVRAAQRARRRRETRK